MLVRRVLGPLALVLAIALATGSSPSVAVAPAGAAATTRQVTGNEPDAAAPRELDLLVGVAPAPGQVTLRAIADDWASGHHVVLQHRTTDGWTNVATRRFSSQGRARWPVPFPRSRRTYRAVTRVDGERYVSPRVTFSG